MKKFLMSEQRLLTALVVLVVLLNVPYGRYVLYPLMIFSTWIHEMCHGIAAVIVGGSIVKLEVFPDGTGLAQTMRPTSAFATAWVASAGYVGTSVIGALMMWFRKRKSAGKVGLTILGALMLLSVAFYVRNSFGIGAVLAIGLVLGVAGWSLKPELSGWLYTFVAATCCLNAITSIQVLFSSNLVVNGVAAGGSDAHTVAGALWLPYWFWAVIWIVFGVVVMLAALSKAVPATPVKSKKRR